MMSYEEACKLINQAVGEIWMQTMQARTQKALTIWQALPPDQQTALLERLVEPFMLFGKEQHDFIWSSVIQLDTTGKEAPKVVSAFFEMDINISSRFVYLFDDDIRGK